MCYFDLIPLDSERKCAFVFLLVSPSRSLLIGYGIDYEEAFAPTPVEDLPPLPIPIPFTGWSMSPPASGAVYVTSRYATRPGARYRGYEPYNGLIAFLELIQIEGPGEEGVQCI